MKTKASIEQLLDLRDRLQAIEDSLVAAGRRNVMIDLMAGAFTWVLQGAGREPNESLGGVADLQAVEDAIASQDHDHLVIMTCHGTFTCVRRAVTSDRRKHPWEPAVRGDDTT